MIFQQFMKSARQAETAGELWQLVLDFAHSYGFVTVAYVSTDVKNLGETGFGAIEDGMPEGFKRRYVEDRLYLDDPFPSLMAGHVDPLYWSDAVKRANLTKGQVAYLELLKEMGIVDGIALQVFGPQARNAMVGFGFPADVPRLSADQMLEIQLASQCAHLRFCALTQGPKDTYTKLSPRELEVLSWIAHGKSNSVIAEIMGISRHTVDTITRRMFEKLDVTDRTRAVVRGIGSGLLSHSGDNLL